MSAEAPIRVLFLRSPSRAPFAAAWAGGLRHARGIEAWQHPAWPEAARAKLAKLPNAEAAWEVLQERLIRDPAEVRRKLESGFFNVVMLSDEDGNLFRASRGGAVGWLRSRFRRGPDLERELGMALPELAARWPLAVVDLADAPFLTPAGQRQLEACTAYFKRELPFDRLFLYYQQRPTPWRKRRQELLSVVAKVRGIPLGIEDDRYAALRAQRAARQEIDVLMVGSPTNSMRLAGLEHLRAWASQRPARVEIHDSLPYSDYCRRMARSRVTISIAGGGWDCFRHYEAVSLGSVPLMNRPTVDAVRWHDLPEELFFDNTFRDFGARLDALLADARLRRDCLSKLEGMVEAHALHSRMAEYAVRTALAGGSGASGAAALGTVAEERLKR